MIPKLSAPLIKDIRTGEGVLEWLLAILGVAAGVTGNLSVSHTAAYLTALAGIKGVRRGLLKLVAVQKGAGIGGPLVPSVLTNVTATANSLIPPAEHVLAEIDAAEKEAAQAQAAPGTPAEQVQAGLSPEPEKAAPSTKAKS